MSTRRVWLLVVCCVCLVSLAFATIFGGVRGIVHDPQHRPIPGAKVVLRAANSQWSMSTSADANGEFHFQRVPLGDYVLTASAPGLQAARQSLAVASGAEPIVHLLLPLATASQTTTVSASVAPAVNVESSTPTTTVSRQQVVRSPGADRPNSLAMITDFVPGAYMVHDQLHVRGGHQVSWLVDGVPVPNTNIASNVGPQFNPSDVDYMEVQRGSYDAEYGDRTYGVFNVVPRSGFSMNNQAELELSLGNFNQTHDELNFGSHTDKFAYFAGLSGNRSDLGLETPVAQVLHDADNGQGGFESLIYNVNADNQLRLAASQRRDFYQIPNTPGQNSDPASFQHDAQRESDAFVNFSWVRTLSPDTLLTVSPLFHYNSANYLGGAQDYPISTTDQRSSTYAGLQTTLTRQTAKDSLEVGFYGFGQRDHELFGLRFNDASHPDFSQPQALSGQIEEAFVEEKYNPWAWLTLMGGVRQSHFAGQLSENATSPRVGLAVQLPRWHWVLRGNYGLYYQAPPLETISGPLLQYVTGQSLAYIPLHGERDEEWQVGMTVPFQLGRGSWGLDMDYFHNRARNFFDHNNVGNSDIFFPLTIAGARIRAFEATVRSPRLWNRGQFHLAYSNQIAEGEGAVSGGLTDFAPGSGYFLLDHDQRNTLNTGLDWNFPGAVYGDLSVYYGSGFANGDAPPSHLPQHAEFSLSAGKQLTDRVNISATALNIFNRHLLIDNSLTFGGTHFNAPREVYVELRYGLKY